MAKTLKFNLKIDKDIQVRTLEDLRNNFVLEDILAYYKRKVLHKWLRVRGFKKEFEQIEELEHKYKLTSEKDILSSLIRIFEIDEDSVSVQDYLDKVQLERQRDLDRKQRADVVASQKMVLNNYFDGYDRLCESIINSPSKTTILKDLETIAANYQIAFARCFYDFYNEASTLSLLCLFINPFTRKIFMDSDEEKGVKGAFKDILVRLSPSQLDGCYDVQKYSNNRTGGSFELVTEKECLVIRISTWGSPAAKCKVAEAHTNYNGSFDRDSINGKFRIFKGLKVFSNNVNNTVYYIEI